MNSIPSDMLYTANEMIKIIKACGEAGVTEFPMNGGVMKLTPRYVAEANVQYAAAPSQSDPQQLPLPLASADFEEIDDPLAWHRKGMNPIDEANDEA